MACVMGGIEGHAERRVLAGARDADSRKRVGKGRVGDLALGGHGVETQGQRAHGPLGPVGAVGIAGVVGVVGILLIGGIVRNGRVALLRGVIPARLVLVRLALVGVLGGVGAGIGIGLRVARVAGGSLVVRRAVGGVHVGAARPGAAVPVRFDRLHHVGAALAARGLAVGGVGLVRAAVGRHARRSLVLRLLCDLLKGCACRGQVGPVLAPRRRRRREGRGKGGGQAQGPERTAKVCESAYRHVMHQPHMSRVRASSCPKNHGIIPARPVAIAGIA